MEARERFFLWADEAMHLIEEITGAKHLCAKERKTTTATTTIPKMFPLSSGEQALY